MYTNAPTLALKSVQIDVGLKKNVSDFFFGNCQRSSCALSKVDFVMISRKTSEVGSCCVLLRTDKPL